MRKFIFVLLLLWAPLPAQQYRYGWFTDTHVGSPGGDSNLVACVNSINARADIAFVVVTGDISETGRTADLTRAKAILSALKVPYYIFPGNHDTKWSESACSAFPRLFGATRFSFAAGNALHIGINSGIPWRGGGGHFEPQDLAWLDSVITALPPEKEVFFYSHQPMDGDVDNWFMALNILKKKNIQFLLCGHGHANKVMWVDSIPSVMSRATLATPKKGVAWGYSIVSDYGDSVTFSEIRADSFYATWAAITKAPRATSPATDSVQFSNGGVAVSWLKNLGVTHSAPLLAAEGFLYSVGTDGVLRCFTSAGREVWQYPLGAPVFSRPVVESGILAVATLEGELITLKAATGKVIQSIGVGEPVTSQLVSAKLDVEGESTFGILFGTASGKLYCYDLYFLNQLWVNNSAAGMIETAPLIEQNRAFFGAWDGYFYCVDITTGQLNWKWTENKNFYYSPAACWPVSDGKSVFVAVPDKFVSSVDLLLGKTNWRKNDANAWESIGISADKKKLFVKSSMNKFFALDALTGKVIKEVDLKFGLDTMPVRILEDNGNIFLSAKNGWVYLIGQDWQPRKLLFLGTARVNSVVALGGGAYAVNNMDGKIVVFSLR